MVATCGMCGRRLNDPADPLSADCGGDCWRCIGAIEADMGWSPSLALVIEEWLSGIRSDWSPPKQLKPSTVLDAAIGLARHRSGDRIPVLGVAGSQGSGKTTLLNDYRKEYPSAATFSLDDFYLPSSYRGLMAERVHPLFATRGVPGTHNLTQLNDTLDDLQDAGPLSGTLVPYFDKVADNPAPRTQRRVFIGRPSVILIDGWCLGATPQTDDQLVEPVNQLEASEDADGVWRREVNANLAGAYSDLFSRLDAIFYLEPPSFDVVLDWRCQQEEGLLGRPLEPADRARITCFVQHFERITRHMMAGGVRADVVVALDANRVPVAVRGG